jgi:hypothetical protein
MSEFKSSNFRNEDGSAAPDIVGVATFTSPHYFVPPSGTTAERPSGDGLAPGMLRFNTDIGRLEVWRGDHWATILGESPNLGVNGALGARGLFFGGGYSPATGVYNIIDYITISTVGNAQDFGDLTQARNTTGSCSSSTRGLCAGGFPGTLNVIDYVTISSTGNAISFGILSESRMHLAGCSNATRGIFGAGWSVEKNTIDYVTISSTGNAVDFGDLTVARYNPGALASSTRGVFAGGSSSVSPGSSNVIDYITISTTGNATDFGDLTGVNSQSSGLSNSTRGLFVHASGSSNIIDFITISTTGNSQDFGDQTVSDRYLPGTFASSTRGIIGGGSAPSTGNTIDYVTILTTGNAVDFGDLTQGRFRLSGCSNAHGGL